MEKKPLAVLVMEALTKWREWLSTATAEPG
jgi:hypothetical protein